MIKATSSFCGYFASVYRALPEVKLPGAKKAALIGLAFFALYKLYRSFHPPSNYELKEDKKSDPAQSPLRNNHQWLNVSSLFMTIKELPTIKKSRGFLNKLKSKIQVLNRKDKGPNQKVMRDLSSSLELFKKAFPGTHLTVEFPNSQITLSDYLIKTLFRITEVTSCVFDPPTSTFTLSYGAPKSFTVNNFPPAMNKSITKIVDFLALFGVEIEKLKGQISQKIIVKFVEIEEGTTIELGKESIFLEGSSTTNYLKSILIPKTGEKLLIEAKYSWFSKSNYIRYQLFADFIHLNF